jgi:hypothetical protein
LLFVGSGIVAYYVFVKGYVYVMEHSEANRTTLEWIANSPYKFALTKDIGMTLKKLYEVALFSMSGVWYPAFGLAAGWGVFALLLGGGIYLGAVAFRRAGAASPSNQAGLMPWRRTIWLAQTLILGTIVFVVSAVPFLAAARQQELVGYRIMFVPMAIIVVLTTGVLHGLAACWRGTRKAFLAAIGMAILITGSVFLSGRHIALVTGNCCTEYNYLRQRLLSADLGNVRDIAIVKLSRKDNLIGSGLLQFECNDMITDAFNLAPIVRQTLRDRGLDPEQCRVACLEPIPTPTAPSDDSTLVIDLYDAKLGGDALRSKDSITKAVFSSCAGNSSGLLALDGDLRSSWETRGFPQSIVFTCPRAGTHVRYQLKSSSEPEQMPKSWIVSSSEDGMTWQQVDAQFHQTWQNSEERSYHSAIGKPQRIFRLTFQEGNSPDTMRIPELQFSVSE